MGGKGESRFRDVSYKVEEFNKYSTAKKERNYTQIDGTAQ